MWPSSPAYPATRTARPCFRGKGPLDAGVYVKPTGLDPFPDRVLVDGLGGLLRETLDRGFAGPLSPIEIERLQILKKWRSNLRRQPSIDPDLVWPMASLERLAEAPRTLGAELQSLGVRQWQCEQFATSLGAVLA